LKVLIPIVLMAAVVIGFGVWVYRLGEGQCWRGRLRAVRRIRRTRRRSIAPLRRRLGRALAEATTRPARKSLAGEVRRLADRVERVHVSSAGFIKQAQRLDGAARKLEGLGLPGSHAPDPRVRARGGKVPSGRGWLVAVGLLVAGAALATVNAWLLYAYVVPALPPDPRIPAAAVRGVLPPAAFAALSFVLGLIYFGLTSAGRRLGFRILAAVVVLAVVAQAALEGAAIVAALGTLGFADPTWWGGIAVAVLLGGAGLLLPPTVASFAHAGIEQAERWIAAGERRAASRDLRTQIRMVDRLRDSLDGMASSIDATRDEIVAVGWEPAGRLLLTSSKETSVDVMLAVLRRLSASLEEEAAAAVARRPGLASVVGRFLAEGAVLVAWVAAAAGAILLSSAGLFQGASAGTSYFVTAGAFAGLAVVLLSGLLLRLAGRVSAHPITPTVRAAGVLLIGLLSVSLAFALGSLAARNGAFGGNVLQTAAWLNVMLLAAAAASVGLPEGVSAVARLVTLVLGTTAAVLLWLVDRALALLERGVVGVRRLGRVPRPEARRNPSDPVILWPADGEKKKAR
jgi:hypothetical protein